MSSRLKDRLNFYNQFKEWYNYIRKEFNFDYQSDLKSRDLLSAIIRKKPQDWRLENILESFRRQIILKPIILIFGCGPSLEDTVNKILSKKEKGFFNQFSTLTADGASVLLKEKNIQIDAIFTDLDGITKNEFNYSRFNIVHAHGDNIEKLLEFEEDIIKFKNVIATTQVEPTNDILNPGGFTDGDRIIFFLRSLINPYQELFLIGMDFKNIVGRYSKLDIKENKEGNQTKKKKLQVAVELITWVRSKLKNDIFFVNSEIINNQFNYISLEDFFKTLKS